MRPKSAPRKTSSSGAGERVAAKPLPLSGGFPQSAKADGQPDEELVATWIKQAAARPGDLLF